jgi:hypothetical protein
MSDEVKDHKDTKESKKDKKKPGRPRKIPLKEKPKRNGIIKEPTSKNSLIEFHYDQPGEIKKIIGTFCKHLECKKLSFIFTPSDMYIYTRNHRETNDARIKFVGSKVNSYYCGKKELEIAIKYENLELITSKINKNCESISFIVTSKDQDKYFYIIIKNTNCRPKYIEMDIMAEFKKCDFRDRFDYDDDPVLEFQMNGKDFKQAIDDTKGFENKWTIEKLSKEDSLSFKYDSPNKQVRVKEIPENIESLSIVDRIPKKDIFSVSYFVSDLKPTSTSQLSEMVKLYIWKNRPMIISADIDNKTIIVDVVINIVDYKKKA